jgi:CDP-diacylglycerol--glycerol-3-phosphate 3-phosphatidyltransferase
MKLIVNLLTALRIIGAFAVIPLLMGQFFAEAFFVFIASAATDFLDGYLARKYNATSLIGGVADHMGDKFLTANALIMSVMFLQIWWVIAPAVIMICRDLYVSGLREFLGTQKIAMPVPKARFSFGKVKAAAQMLALSAIFLWIWAVNADWASEFMTGDMLWIGIGGLWIALFFSVVSAGQYTITFIQAMKKRK